MGTSKCEQLHQVEAAIKVASIQYCVATFDLSVLKAQKAYLNMGWATTHEEENEGHRTEPWYVIEHCKSVRIAMECARRLFDLFDATLFNLHAKASMVEAAFQRLVEIENSDDRILALLRTDSNDKIIAARKNVALGVNTIREELAAQIS